MRKLFALVGLGFLLTACPNKPDGNLTGVLDRPVYVPEVPIGMAYVPSGGFQQGENDGDVPFLHQTRARSVSVQAFYIDETEISNNEYRQFVHWVRDSIAKELLIANLYRHESITDRSIFDPQSLRNEETWSQPGDSSWRKGSYNGDVLTELNENWEPEDSYRWLNYEDVFYDEFDMSKGNGGNPGSRYFRPFDSEAYPTLSLSGIRKIFNLNWADDVDYSDAELIPTLTDLYLPEKERFYKKREFDTRKFIFQYWWFDYRMAAERGKLDVTLRPGSYLNAGEQPSNNHDEFNNHRKLDSLPFGNNPITDREQTFAEPGNPLGYLADTFVGGGQDKDMGWLNKKGQNNAIRGHQDRSRFIIMERIPVYPDTLCWVRDFTYSFHDPMTNMYFWHPAYDHYPVVGITWVQAKAFSVWRTQLMNMWRQANQELFIQDFRLPTEAEWERAARGDLENSQYPWGGPYIRNSSGCFLGNFKPMRGRYFEDGGFHTVKVYSYSPNNFGLYCMAGNVAEWCETAYDESMYEFSHDLNPEFRYDALDWDAEALKRKIIRGGSWKDVGYYLMNATRTYEYQDTAKCYIGFRNVVTHMGRGGKDITSPGETSEEPRSDIQLR
jgi:formylglycine-generating enzyme required for sulfatase activity